MRVLVTKTEGGEWFQHNSLYDALHGVNMQDFAAVWLADEGVVFDGVLLRMGRWPWRTGYRTPRDGEVFPPLDPMDAN